MAARHGAQLFTGVNVTFHVFLERIVVESADCGTSETWLEQCFCATEAFADNSEDVSVGAQTCREDNGEPLRTEIQSLAVYAHRRGLPDNNHVSRACDAVVKGSEGEPERHPIEG